MIGIHEPPLLFLFFLFQFFCMKLRRDLPRVFQFTYFSSFCTPTASGLNQILVTMPFFTQPPFKD